MSDEFDLHHDRGWKLYKEEKYEEAIREWREASRLSPESGDVLNDIARALSELGHREAAITEWREAIRREPDHEWAHINLASALILSGALLEALAPVRAALSLSPESADLLNYLGYLLMRQAKEDNDTARLAEAGAAFEKVTLLDPSNAYASEHLAQVQWHLKQRHEAIKTLKVAAAANPDNAALLIQLGKYQGAVKDIPGVIRTIRATNKLSASPEMQRHYAEVSLYWPRVRFLLLTVTGLLGTMICGWVRYRRRG